jgi:predicted nucleic acid-binding protein
VADSSTLIALERVSLIKLLNKIGYKIIISKAVKEEIKSGKILKLCRVEELKGRTLKLSKSLENLNIGKGEAQCCALANKLKLDFIICDDRKFLRQRFFSNNKQLQNIKILGFSFFLHIFYKKGLIKDVWIYFDEIIKLNNWERSEILVANYTFLKEIGY